MPYICYYNSKTSVFVDTLKTRVSNKLKKQLRKLNIHVVFKRGRTIGSILCNNKPKNTNDKRKNVIYRIPCECGMVYFGETGQWFDARVQQHQTAVKKLDVKNGIAAHVQQTGHTVRWSEAKCIDQHNYYANRKMKEAIYISMLMLQVKAILVV